MAGKQDAGRGSYSFLQAMEELEGMTSRARGNRPLAKALKKASVLLTAHYMDMLKRKRPEVQAAVAEDSEDDSDLALRKHEDARAADEEPPRKKKKKKEVQQEDELDDQEDREPAAPAQPAPAQHAVPAAPIAPAPARAPAAQVPQEHQQHAQNAPAGDSPKRKRSAPSTPRAHFNKDKVKILEAAIRTADQAGRAVDIAALLASPAFQGYTEAQVEQKLKRMRKAAQQQGGREGAQPAPAPASAATAANQQPAARSPSAAPGPSRQAGQPAAAAASPKAQAPPRPPPGPTTVPGSRKPVVDVSSDSDSESDDGTPAPVPVYGMYIPGRVRQPGMQQEKRRRRKPKKRTKLIPPKESNSDEPRVPLRQRIQELIAEQTSRHGTVMGVVEELMLGPYEGVDLNDLKTRVQSTMSSCPEFVNIGRVGVGSREVQYRLDPSKIKFKGRIDRPLPGQWQLE